MACWEWFSSSSSTIDIIVNQFSTDADGNCASDLVYLPSKSVKKVYTLKAKFLTDGESATEEAKIGTTATFTDHRGNTITGVVAGHSQDAADTTGKVNVTLQLIVPWVSA